MFCFNPKKGSNEAAKRIIRSSGARDKGIMYELSTNQGIKAFSDAEFSGTHTSSDIFTLLSTLFKFRTLMKVVSCLHSKKTIYVDESKINFFLIRLLTIWILSVFSYFT